MICDARKTRRQRPRGNRADPPGRTARKGRALNETVEHDPNGEEQCLADEELRRTYRARDAHREPAVAAQAERSVHLLMRSVVRRGSRSMVWVLMLLLLLLDGGGPMAIETNGRRRLTDMDDI
jgi:hypothetical protein